jgi:hypothetical protein
MDKEIGDDFDFGHLFLSVFTFMKIKFTKDLGKCGYAVVSFKYQKIIENCAA